MDEQYWQDVADSLSEDVKRLSIEKAVARSEVKKLASLYENLLREYEEFKTNNSTVHNISTKE